MDKQTKRFKALFRGYDHAYGTYEITGTNKRKNKKEGTATTVREEITDELWAKHLAGEQSLGVMPINQDNECLWGCLDVDVYDGLDHAKLLKDFNEAGLPFVVCRSKSGGAHAFLFFESPVLAYDLQMKLKEIAAAFGLSKCDIFPRQSQVLWDKGDVGSWLNLPYFNAAGSLRYGIAPDGSALPLPEFLDTAEAARIDPAKLEDLVAIKEMEPKKTKAGKVTEEDEVLADFEGGPPCIQILARRGFSEGSRNNSMFHVGVFARKKFPDRWQEKLEDWNQRYFDPPLNSQEMQTILKSLTKKDYRYKCDENPMASHCDSATCRTRKHGVGDGGYFPSMTAITKLMTDPPIWFIDLDGTRLELTTEQLQNQVQFQKRCLDVLNIMPPRMKEQAWNNVVNTLLADVKLVQAPMESTRVGLFDELITTFLTDRHAAKERDEILIGKPWLDEENNLHVFRLRDFEAFLKRNDVRDMTRGWITARLRDIGGQYAFVKIRNKGTNVWTVPKREAKGDKLPTPKQKNPSF